jgi:hypothetical protein
VSVSPNTASASASASDLSIVVTVSVSLETAVSAAVASDATSVGGAYSVSLQEVAEASGLVLDLSADAGEPTSVVYGVAVGYGTIDEPTVVTGTVSVAPDTAICYAICVGAVGADASSRTDVASVVANFYKLFGVS